MRQTSWSWLQAPKQRRWSLAAWTFVRPGLAGAGIAPASQLGGSQSGFRFQRRLFERRSLTASANVRVSSATNVPGKEAALGISLRRKGHIPVELIVERRVGLDSGGRDAVAALLVSGVDDLSLPRGTLLSGYLQAGVVGLNSRDGFVDGSARIEKPLLHIGKTRFRLGAGVWGAVQPGVSRLDVGPSLASTFRLGRTGVRVSGEWRQRVAGNALPGSGPTLTVGVDY